MSEADPRFDSARGPRPLDGSHADVAPPYQLARVTFPFTVGSGDSASRFEAAGSTRVQQFTAPGDHLYLLELVGSDVIAVSLGKGRAFIPMHEGDELSFPMSTVYVKNLSSALQYERSGSTMTCEALFLVSSGPLIRRTFKPAGFFGGFPMARGTATTAGVSIMAQVIANRTWEPAGASTIGWGVASLAKWGGTLGIRNLDATKPLFLYNGVPGAFMVGGAAGTTSELTSWQIDPGSTHVFEAESRLARRYTGDPFVNADAPAGALGVVEPCLAVAAGTALFNVVISRLSVDGSDPDSHVLKSTPALSF